MKLKTDAMEEGGWKSIQAVLSLLLVACQDLMLEIKSPGQKPINSNVQSCRKNHGKNYLFWLAFLLIEIIILRIIILIIIILIMIMVLCLVMQRYVSPMPVALMMVGNGAG